MQPKTTQKFDEQVFNDLKRTIMNMSRASRMREADSRYAMDVPEDIGIKLNNGCNLRCKHCYEWNEDGFHRDMAREDQKKEIDIALVEKLLAFTREKKSKLYLWGGEPLYYSQFFTAGRPARTGSAHGYDLHERYFCWSSSWSHCSRWVKGWSSLPAWKDSKRRMMQ
ncbi:radical SAM protein [Paenibacillus rhizoplanae]